MNLGAMARIAKIVAVVGFFLPWVLVSCSNQTLFSATGVDLAMGSVNIHNPMNGAVEHHNGHADVPILLAMMAIAIGLVGTFLLARRDAARLMLGTSLAALLLSFAGVQAAHDPQRLKSGPGEAGQSDGGLGDAALAMVKVENRFGYYLTLLGLTAAAGFSFAALYGVGTLRTRASELGGLGGGRRLAIAAQAAFPARRSDIAWDGMADKNDATCCTNTCSASPPVVSANWPGPSSTGRGRQPKRRSRRRRRRPPRRTVHYARRPSKPMLGSAPGNAARPLAPGARH